MTKPTRIKSVELQGGFVVRLGLTDGTSKTVNLEKYLHGPIFETIRAEPARFSEVHVDSRAGTIVWPNGADIDPDVLCQGLKPCWAEDEPDAVALPTHRESASHPGSGTRFGPG
jgi:hypothetical protein